MATYAFFNVPAWGHVNPTLAIVQELVARGHAVSYYLPEEFRATVEATGATFQPYVSRIGHAWTKGFADTEKGGGIIRTILADKETVGPQIIDRLRAERPDVIIYGYMCSWAKGVAEELAVPAISTRATYASNDHFDAFRDMRTRLQGAAILEEFSKLSGANAEHDSSPSSPQAELLRLTAVVEPLNIIVMSSIFQPLQETFDDRYLFIGTSILPRHQESDFPFDQLDRNRPLLYISLGSIMTNQPAFYKLCFEAFGDQPWQVVLPIGRHTDRAQLEPVPSNFILAPSVPQLEILPRTRLFVTHAGTNSIMESLFFGVPMVLIPQQPEQYMHALRAVELGLGVQLDKNTLTASALRQAVESVADNSSYQEQAHHVQNIVQADGGYQRAVDAIIQFTRTHAKHS
ncbi:macrolide family glycosyltransferase [Tengunoibacter tsumagoiensis]|uniref:Putative UDP-glucosyltransferase YjiC n=1 Tax=Tengunoibacter tsumagoiensis TaxID=2014871 RepID=A0A402A8V0_9CHLR|nr:macrolide family glycosyltransferase [Tengunoibacter tsumagoiensis]GCE15582.1 putative UDP-glucosyltransferase YjiC [Tengunoibacter tsumagoiensis]